MECTEAGILISLTFEQTHVQDWIRGRVPYTQECSFRILVSQSSFLPSVSNLSFFSLLRTYECNCLGRCGLPNGFLMCSLNQLHTAVLLVFLFGAGWVGEEGKGGEEC